MTGTILLVEDNPSDEKLTVLALKRCGVPNQVVVVRDGAEALEYLLPPASLPESETQLRPNLVLLDLSLPRVDGLEVLRQMRAEERTRLLPVVVLTASSEEEDVHRSYTLGANAYLRKPVDLADLDRAARTLTHFWLVMNHQPPASNADD
jgi:CheY-like chemotaxis protein